MPDTEYMIPLLPFEARCNPRWEAAEAQVRTWLNFLYPHRSTADEHSFADSRTAKLTGYSFPDADLDDLVTLTAATEALFECDDRIAYDGHSSMADAQGHASRLQCVLETGQADVSDGPDLIAMAAILQRIYPRQSESWKTRFRKHIWSSIFATAAEFENRSEDRVPGVREYIAIRRETIGVITALDLAEFSGHYELPETLYHNPQLNRLRHSCIDTVAWMNDIYSYHREEAAGEINLVHVLRTENETSLVRTFEAIYGMIESRISYFVDAERTLRTSDTYHAMAETDRAGVAASVEAMKNAMVGGRQWQAEVSRYALTRTGA
ncbi:hypothetical protein AB0M22_27775 [Nocardia sp. NPDC051756]|uniref:terpene synthase family protein n=1 Tax=Nocardia sp. NPDC051756 TaxID=3154751 RepID=UPI0034326D46